ncbi:ATP-binding protein [Streptomyces sp. NPDC005970]|uniref:ATP-binding protein n=1 Tax=Streptomyces sp. NPDC005970 TaxID=3156723 RepID=UPI0033FF0B76
MPTTATADQRRDTFCVSRDERSVPGARTRVRKILADWGLTGDLADDVTLSADELVSNAIKHCDAIFAEIEISVSVQGGALILEVSDPEKFKIPHVRNSTSEEESGRGLYLVSLLAESWGFRSRTYGKCVWARFVIAKEVTCTD